MLLDSQNLFSENQEITSRAIHSQNIINFGKNDVSFAPVIIQAVSDFSNLTSLTVKIQTSSTPEFSEAVDLIESKLELENLKSGAKFPICHLPKGNLGYMRIVYIVDGANETTGKVTAGVVASDELSYQDLK